jgi:hypothetical protein
MLYLCGWLLAALVLPAMVEDKPYVHNLVLLAGTMNLLLFLVPGRINQRALQAYGAFALLGLVLWVLGMWSGWLVAQKTRKTASGYPSASHSDSEAEGEPATVCSVRGRAVTSRNRTSEAQKELPAWDLAAKTSSPGGET